MHVSHYFFMRMHVKLHTPVPLSGVSDVIAIFSNGRHCDVHIILNTIKHFQEAIYEHCVPFYKI